jgi:hypothetical protein
MLARMPRHSWLAAAAVAVPLIGLATVRVAGLPYPFATPVFGLATAASAPFRNPVSGPSLLR